MMKVFQIIRKILYGIFTIDSPSVIKMLAESFGDTAKLFEAIDEGELKEKLKETVDKMHEMLVTPVRRWRK